MAEETTRTKLVASITDMEKDFAQWYTDVVIKAELADYSSARGCIIYRPYGMAIWELIQNEFNARFKQTGHENVYMPLLIPESLLQKEKDHVKGFAPEVAWVTHGGMEKLTERFCIRPTSETLFCDHYANIIQSYRDLPKLYNQWCSVVRWEKTTRPFLRGLEFMWQEGHTAHATAEEAQAETLGILDIYADVCAEMLAVPVIKGQKTESDKFAGAEATYCIESLMHDGQSLQSGTTHNFGDGFARAFGIQYTDRNNKLRYAHQTSWGVSTRLIGAVIMVHGDNSGLVLPPRVAPVQVVVIPVAQHKAGVLELAREVTDALSKKFRVKLDDSDKNPGWKFSEYEMKGVPVRLEIGPRDIENGVVQLARRDTGAKTAAPIGGASASVENLLEDIQRGMYAKALAHLEAHTYSALDMAEIGRVINETPGFIKAMWCGGAECEDTVKKRTGVTSRCIPFEQEALSGKCVCCGKKAEKLVYWGRAY
ncbi:MAG: proline--tRNA ligase [Clostridiales bacterium]|nr:proline--tRNA ligase [Clostridiales bacterium]